jgi:hypothetical protein
VPSHFQGLYEDHLGKIAAPNQPGFLPRVKRKGLTFEAGLEAREGPKKNRRGINGIPKCATSGGENARKQKFRLTPDYDDPALPQACASAGTSRKPLKHLRIFCHLPVTLRSGQEAPDVQRQKARSRTRLFV